MHREGDLVRISELEQRLAMIRRAQGDLDAFAVVMETVVARLGDRSGVVQTGDITIIESGHEAWQGKQSTFTEVVTRPEVEQTTVPLPGTLLPVPFGDLVELLSAYVWRFKHRTVKRVTVYADTSVEQGSAIVAIGEAEAVVIMRRS